MRIDSIKTQLPKMFSDVVRAIDSIQLVFQSLLDMSAAFDTVDHGILFQRMSRWFGVKDGVISWLETYIHKRTNTNRPLAEEKTAVVFYKDQCLALFFLCYIPPMWRDS